MEGGVFLEEDIQKGKKIRDEDSVVYVVTFCKNEPIDKTALPDFTTLAELVAWVDKTHFSSLSDTDTKAFYLEYSIYPPDVEYSFTSKIWKKFIRPRRPREGKISKPSPERVKEILKEFRAFQDVIAQHKLAQHSKDMQD